MARKSSELLVLILLCSVSFSLPSHHSFDSGPELRPLADEAAILDPTYHYEPVPGKVVGVWPDTWSLARLAELKQKYGFSGVVIFSDLGQYTNALTAGFAPANILIRTLGDDYIGAVDNFPAGIYYLDEATEHDCYGHPTSTRLYTPQELATRSDYVHTQRPGSLFVSSGYKRCSHLQIASSYVDLMMYSAYRNWDQFFFPCHVNMGWGDEWENSWLSGSDDQRNSWSSMRQMLGTKFSITWIHGGGDQYPELFAHANTLGLTGMWQYNGAAIDSARLESFCYAAWQNGWLERVPDEPLPIQLAWFTATVLPPGGVRLAWRTLSEINNYGFEMQRRTDATAFSTIPNSFVPGHGTTIDPHDYSFIDSPEILTRLAYRLKQYDLDGSVHYGPEAVVDLSTGISVLHDPEAFVLFQNYPNPFNPTTNIRFSVPDNGTRSRPPAADGRISDFGFVSLKVIDMLGREVATLVNEEKPVGTYEVPFNALNLSSGMYFYRLSVGGFVQTRKLMLVR